MSVKNDKITYEFQQLYTGETEEVVEKFNANFERLLQLQESAPTIGSSLQEASFDILALHNYDGLLDFVANGAVDSGISYNSGTKLFTMSQGRWHISGTLACWFWMILPSNGNIFTLTFTDYVNGLANRQLCSRQIGIGFGPTIVNRAILIKLPLSIYRDFNAGDTWGVHLSSSNWFGQPAQNYNYSINGIGSANFGTILHQIGPEGLMFSKVG